MNKKQAQQYIGQRVSVWTSQNGEYEGELIEVKCSPGRPWRGLVKIDTVVAPAFFDDYPRQRYKRTKSVGDLIEAGSSSIRPA
jgi:hypothetical protein